MTIICHNDDTVVKQQDDKKFTGYCRTNRIVLHIYGAWRKPCKSERPIE